MHQQTLSIIFGFIITLLSSPLWANPDLCGPIAQIPFKDLAELQLACVPETACSTLFEAACPIVQEPPRDCPPPCEVLLYGWPEDRIPCLDKSEIPCADLLSVYQIALDNDPSIRSARAALLASAEAYPQARSMFFPVINATSSYINHNKRYYGNNIQLSNTVIPLSTNVFQWVQGAYSLNLTQPVFYYQSWVQLAKANAQVKQANAVYTSAEQDLIFRTIQSYFNVLRAIDSLKFAEAQQKAFQKQVDETQGRFKAGIKSTSITDVQNAIARLDSANALVISSRNNLEIQKKILMQITNVPIHHFASLKRHIDIQPPEPQNMDQWICTALEQNLDLEAARYQVKAAREDIRMREADHLPQVNITGAIVRLGPSRDLFIEPGNRDAQIGVSASIPIYSGGSVISKTRQARYLYDQSLDQMEVTYRQVESNTSQSYLNVITQISQVQSQKQSMISAKTALESTQASVNAGVQYTVVDVLNAISNLISTQQNYANARYDYIIQSVMLKKNAGLLCPEDIIKINEYLCD